ncbi:MAG: DNA polymerase III subunit gamma/tau, partial [Bacteroidaceae bacterium]|nr:DNA polymerase III subunit gamma/tau [Bacteroidaceae bacterium]
GKYKVFIIDEVHMLSAAAFNAFLKTLEEPPSYVIFILATTEKHKILPTILSRCQVYDFARMTIQNTVDHLAYIAQKEGYTAETAALNLIAQKADGGMRDALSILDQMASYSNGQITYERTLENLNILDSEYYFRVTDMALKNDIPAAVLLLDEVIGRGFDPGHFIAGLASHMRNLLVAADPKTLPLLETSDEQRARFQAQAKQCPVRFIYSAIRLCNECDLNYRQSRNKRLQVELCLIEMAQLTEGADAPGSGRSPITILKPIFERLASGMGAQSSPQAAAAPQGAQQPAPVRPATAAAPTAAQPSPTVQTSRAPSRSINRVSIARPSLAPGKTAAAPQAEETVQAVVAPSVAPQDTQQEIDAETLSTCWRQYAASLPQEHKALATRMLGIAPRLLSGTSFAIEVPSDLVAQEFNKFKRSIEQSIAAQARISILSMTVNVQAPLEAATAISKTDIYQQMIADNPELELMRQAFDLVIV